MSAPTLGEQLDEIMTRMDVATAAWARAGHPLEGPEAAAREWVFDELRAWTERARQRTSTPVRIAPQRSGS